MSDPLVTKIGMVCRLKCCASVITIRNYTLKQTKRFLVRDGHRDEFIAPEGWKEINESHYGGSFDNYPKLKALLGDKDIIELPEKKHLWTDR
jgi:hypothetical protein